MTERGCSPPTIHLLENEPQHALPQSNGMEMLRSRKTAKHLGVTGSRNAQKDILMKISLSVLMLFVATFVALPTHAQTEIECPEPFITDATPAYYIGLGDAAFDRGDYPTAVIAYTCAIDLEPGYAPTYANRGYAHAALQNIEAALADYNRAVELDEALVSTYVNRGALYTAQGNFSLAMLDFTVALTLDPNNAVALNNRAIVHAAERNFDLAMADLEQAIALAPAYAAPRATLAAVYSALAAQNYQEYVAIVGEEARLPAGTPTEVIIAVDESLRTGDFAIWLALLAPAEG
jgi:tetratricopeptide (TPR) repeat protein